MLYGLALAAQAINIKFRRKKEEARRLFFSLVAHTNVRCFDTYKEVKEGKRGNARVSCLFHAKRAETYDDAATPGAFRTIRRSNTTQYIF